MYVFFSFWVCLLFLSSRMAWKLYQGEEGEMIALFVSNSFGHASLKAYEREKQRKIPSFFPFLARFAQILHFRKNKKEKKE